MTVLGIIIKDVTTFLEIIIKDVTTFLKNCKYSKTIADRLVVIYPW